MDMLLCLIHQAHPGYKDANDNTQKTYKHNAGVNISGMAHNEFSSGFIFSVAGKGLVQSERHRKEESYKFQNSIFHFRICKTLFPQSFPL